MSFHGIQLIYNENHSKPRFVRDKLWLDAISTSSTSGCDEATPSHRKNFDENFFSVNDFLLSIFRRIFIKFARSYM